MSARDTKGPETAEVREAPVTYGDLAAPLFREVIAPSFEREVRGLVASRLSWRKAANWVEGGAHVLLGGSSILAFTAGFYDSKLLSYASACCSTVCISMLRFAAYAANESSDRNAVLSRQLAAVGLSPMPDLADAPGGARPSPAREPERAPESEPV
jgi:hypothetical protein